MELLLTTSSTITIAPKESMGVEAQATCFVVCKKVLSIGPFHTIRSPVDVLIVFRGVLMVFRGS